ncbi:hypothetical protein MCBMB27_02601 [Methylobacterium phyllosphaerae]|uniref:Uncharacterized protein n=1 Tax=Methylobacterium phyllosphaerae TaxID=418223 RepID=A0AAE8HSL1_9HYPH|nr:hypothetical protein [Methylobacterium phyllosphaerae]APT31892.1 hypothetical protein MCBMB27_02601 [Methylobacterium phyllosphaerae]SFH02005.1 hypothetical protein SAMN05192567_11266 [Methylobacterium phyllosphaerae]
MGERKRRIAAGYVPPAYLTDCDRMAFAIPATLVGALVFADVFGPDPDAPDPVEAQAEIAAKTKQLRDLIIAGCSEPFVGLAIGPRSRLLRRTADLCQSCIRAMGFEDQSSVKFGMVYYYWLEDLLARDVLSLAEGSSMAEAVTLLLPMMEHGFAVQARDASARKQAARMLRWFQERGFYVEAEMEARCA